MSADFVSEKSAKMLGDIIYEFIKTILLTIGIVFLLVIRYNWVNKCCLAIDETFNRPLRRSVMSTKKSRMIRPLLIISAIAVLLAALLFAGWKWLDRCHFKYTNRSTRIVHHLQDNWVLDAAGYSTPFPYFEPLTYVTEDRELPVYEVINNEVWRYAIDVSTEYTNYAKLEYEVLRDDERLTVSFSGYGYPDEGKGEPIPISKDFVFDISRVNDGVLPVLLEG